MMTLDKTRDAVAFAMYDLEKRVKDEGRIRTTTDGIFQRLTTTVASGNGYVSGQMIGDDYWRYVGNGRGPGGMPPVQKIQDWINRAGLTLNAFVVARKIGKEGTRNFRQGKPNVFLSAADAWANSASVTKAQEVAATEISDVAFDIIKRNIKP